MYKDWLYVCSILLAIFVTFGIMGSMEKLSPDAERKLELARQGLEDKITLAGGL